MLFSEMVLNPLSEGDERLRVPDLIVAGVIVLAAGYFWMWDNVSTPKPSAAPVTALSGIPSAAPIPAVPAADQFNNDGTRLYQSADYSGAEALFRKAIAANPASALGYCNLGADLIPQHRYDEAIAALQKAVSLDPTLALARNNLSWAQQEKAKHPK